TESSNSHDCAMKPRELRTATKSGRGHASPSGETAGGGPQATLLADIFALGLNHHKAGRLAEAENCYRQVLAVRPDHADALHLLGVIARRLGRHDVAISLINQAIERNATNPIYFSDLGRALD